MMGANGSTQDTVPQSKSSTFTRSSSFLNRPHSVSRSSKLLTLNTNSDAGIFRDQKRSTRLGSLRRRFSKSPRFSHLVHQIKAFRDLISDWTPEELHSLETEYESLSVLKELTDAADSARYIPNSIVQDLLSVFENKSCTDLDLIYKGEIFPVHRAILCCRCSFFRELLSHSQDHGAQIPVSIKTPGVDTNLFAALLRYLYTGDFGLEPGHLHNARHLIQQLSVEFGPLHSMNEDLRTLFERGSYADAILAFSFHTDNAMSISGRGEGQIQRNPDGTPNMTHLSNTEFLCHRVVLAARSPFFHQTIHRRAQSREALLDRLSNSPTIIVLDESVIPRRFAKVILRAVYLDAVDLSLILPSNPTLKPTNDSKGNTTKVSTAGQSTLDEAMELYCIARLLDLPKLAQGCEDIIKENINVNTLGSILKWSSEPHGSPWIRRQAMQYLQEEFLNVAQLPIFPEFSKDVVKEAIGSNFLQASEREVLLAVIKWGENNLARSEEQDRKWSSHTLQRRGTKKRNSNDVELINLLYDILPLIRTDHIIPRDCEVLSNAIKRGLVSQPPSHMVGKCTGHSTACTWVREADPGLFVRPRLFPLYYEEIKLFNKEHTDDGAKEQQLVRPPRNPASRGQSLPIPDALYVLDELSPKSRFNSQSCISEDMSAEAMPVIDKKILLSMRRREFELGRSRSAQKSFLLLDSDRSSVSYQLALRVVREFGFHDTAVELLKGVRELPTSSRDLQLPAVPKENSPEPVIERPAREPVLKLNVRKPAPKPPSSSPTLSSRLPRSLSGSSHASDLVNDSKEEEVAEAPSHLEDTLPDIALASAASFNRQSEPELNVSRSSSTPEIELDLGDGASHS